MKLRDDDKKWLKDEISGQVKDAIVESLDEFKPHGMRRVGFWLREWGLVAVAVATPLTLLGLLITVSIFAASGLTKNAEFRIHTEDRLTAIEKDIGSIRDSLKTLSPLLRETTVKRINEAGNLTPKQLSEQLADLKILAKAAKTENIPITPVTVQKIGKKLIELGSPDAWNATLDFMNYKSFLNVSLSVAVNDVQASGVTTTVYQSETPSGLESPKFGIAGVVPKEKAAQFLKMGQPDPNQSLGNDWIVVTGGSLIIDNMRLKKVILNNVRVFYSGTPLEMENVYFINCTFDVKQQPNGERFAMAVLVPTPAIAFKAA